MICPRCKRSGELSDRYDAVYCRSCDQWLESPCEDGTCWASCAERPKKPSLAVLGLRPGERSPAGTDDPRHFLSRLLSRLEGTEAQRHWIREEIKRKGQPKATGTTSAQQSAPLCPRSRST